MTTRHTDTRQHILCTGKHIIAAKGFSSVGLAELLQASEVPKGSFYHYFKSKELFGQALLEDYFTDYLAQLDTLLQAPGLSGRDRLLRYFEQWRTTQADDCCEQKCLVVKLSAEVSDLSEAMRLTLRDGTEHVIARLGQCIADAVEDGSLAAVEPLPTARTLYALWLGANLLAKLHRNAEPLEQAWSASLRLLAE
ncbi:MULTISPECIES: TetR/AcrR family transcriptional regulator [Thauera]|uniref:Transcriptional regulator n=1 Tax=Thauera aminoaromatica S2 TaxID=1234381 RepID=N6YUP1_THASP|nr:MULTISPECIES: TetR/AcrR family transcriptional regulator [Thauera]ENO85853.1 transcriptional regulator [Thauera aminoaromatica S2]KIN88833.1 bacterial regulatory s, tetR family protein [Thauera sp. SWB20]